MATKTVRALMTVEIGTQLKPVTVKKGDLFKIDESDPEELIARGIAADVVPEKAAVVAAPAADDKK